MNNLEKEDKQMDNLTFGALLDSDTTFEELGEKEIAWGELEKETPTPKE